MENNFVLTMTQRDYEDMAYLIKNNPNAFTGESVHYFPMYTLRYLLLSNDVYSRITFKYDKQTSILDIHVAPEANVLMTNRPLNTSILIDRFGKRQEVHVADNGIYSFSVYIKKKEKSRIGYYITKNPEDQTRALWLTSNVEWETDRDRNRYVDKTTPLEIILQLFHWGTSMVRYLPFALTRSIDAKGVEHIKTANDFRQVATEGIERHVKEKYWKHYFDGWDVVRLEWEQFEKIMALIDETGLISDFSTLPLERVAIQIGHGDMGLVALYTARQNELSFVVTTEDNKPGEDFAGIYQIRQIKNPLTGETTLVADYDGDIKDGHPMGRLCGKEWTTADAVYNIFLYVESFMLNYRDETMDVEERICEKQSEPGRKKKHHRNSVRLFKSYTLKKGWKSKANRKKAEIHCLAWGVRGHYRHYRNGKVIFINSYVKGKEREKYVGKDYFLLPAAQ